MPSSCSGVHQQLLAQSELHLPKYATFESEHSTPAQLLNSTGGFQSCHQHGSPAKLIPKPFKSHKHIRGHAHSRTHSSIIIVMATIIIGVQRNYETMSIKIF